MTEERKYEALCAVLRRFGQSKRSPQLSVAQRATEPARDQPFLHTFPVKAMATGCLCQPFVEATLPGRNPWRKTTMRPFRDRIKQLLHYTNSKFKGIPGMTFSLFQVTLVRSEGALISETLLENTSFISCVTDRPVPLQDINLMPKIHLGRCK